MSGWQRMDDKGIVLHHLVLENMLLDDALDHLWGGAVIPHAIGINDHDGALLANPKAVRFGAKNTGRARGRRAIESQVFEPLLQIVPRIEAGFERAALG